MNVYIPSNGVTGMEDLNNGPTSGWPPGYGPLGAAEGRPICFAHHPTTCACLHDHPMAVVYVHARMFNEVEARTQLDACYQAADQLDARVVGWFVDSGSSEAPERPGLDALLARLDLVVAKQSVWRTRPVEYVIVSRPDRIARRLSTWERITGQVTDRGARLVFASEVLA